MKFDRPVTPARVEITPGGHVRFYDDRGDVLTPQSQTLQREFPRPKGPKSVYRVAVGGDVPLSAMLPTMLSNFSRLYVIDTNTRASGSSSLSIAVVALSQWRPYDRSHTIARQEMVAALELHNVRDVNPEVLAWKLLIDRIRSATDYDPGWRVGIAVDSELGALAEWNARKRPLLGDTYVPTNFTLVYASADKRRDTLLNDTMFCCDWLASFLFERLPRGGADFEMASIGAGCSAWRLWELIQVDKQTTITSRPWSAKLDSAFRPQPLPRFLRSPSPR